VSALQELDADTEDLFERLVEMARAFVGAD
jgi:hypothetical protein